MRLCAGRKSAYLRGMSLFSRLLRLPRRARFDAPLMPDDPFFAIGDLHGCDTLLARLLEQIAAMEQPGAPLVFLGDYIDRGDNSAALLARLHRLSGAGGAKVICLMGNHERMMLEALDDPAHAGPRWLRHGGLQTLASFGIAPPGPDAAARVWEAMRDALRAALGPEQEAWLRGLPLYWQSGNVMAVHAGADPARPIPEQGEETLLWGHADFGRAIRSDGLWVVHGHTIVEAPLQHRGRIAIDTGAYATGRLTAALIAPGAVSFHSA
jgi:serine/threonine protein phosphatase 1